ncbi:restriction endonuclease subunit S [Chitinophagaceae bacterium LB-8]|uniref:Restriction endonuclease subunit S n=1 Tax=Paraflavisolibacter caeni TaxID=2982496 RepID=A0A9X2XSK4_9BACT|nr:restriction endonuclease subunit S [Paraflavisolibacter caeni]MCU7548141.1 restriction endonuclease subunit S [Paraflavisolibacter caeni]
MSGRKVRIGDFLKRVKEPVKIIAQDEYTLVTIRMYHKGVVKRATVKGSSIKSSTLYSIKTNQFILSGIDARNAAFGIVPNELNGAVVTNDFWSHDINTNIIDLHYFYWLTTTSHFNEACIKASEGTTNRQRLQADKFYEFEVYLPHIEEQKELVKRFGFIKNKLQVLNDELNNQQSYLQLLRQTILQEAVQGKLTKRDEEDESASELLKRIKAEKQKLVREGKLKKEKELPPIADGEIPFELPKGWVWCRVGEVISLISGQHIEAHDYNEVGVGVPYLTGPSDFGDLKPVFTRWTEKPKVFAQKDDILITVKGSGVGKLNLLHEDNVAIGRQLMAIRTVLIKRDFVKLFLASIYDKLQDQKSGIAIPGISREDILEKAFPLPPMNTQLQIIAKVEQLLQYINNLEQHIFNNQIQSQQLLQAVLKEAFEGTDKVHEENEILTIAAEA